MSEIKKDFEENVINFKFDVNNWGSAQYASALAFFEFLKRHNLQEIEKELEFTIIINEINKFENIKKELKKNLDQLRGRYIDNCKTFEDFFIFYRANSFDLWTTAETLARSTFKDLKIENLPRTKGFGSPLNQKIQELNYITGLYCYLFIHYNLIKKEECFQGFDT